MRRQTGIFAVLLLCSACTLPKVKIGDPDKAADAGRDELGASEAERTRSAAGEGGADDGDDSQPAAKGGKSGQGRAGAGGMAAAGSGGRGGSGASAGAAGSASADGGTDAGRELDEPVAKQKWSSPAMLLQGESVRYLQHAVDAKGRAVAVWEANATSSEPRAFAQRYVDGAWTSPVRIAGSAKSALGPGDGIYLAADPTGRAVVVTCHGYSNIRPFDPQMPDTALDLLVTEIYASAMSEDGAWSNAELLGEGFIPEPQLAINAAGAAVVASVKRPRSAQSISWELWARSYEPGSGWANPINLSTASATADDSEAVKDSATDYPKTIGLSRGAGEQAMVAWTRDSGLYASPLSEFANRIEQWSPTEDSFFGFVGVRTDDYDRSTVVWTHKTGERVQLHAKRYIRSSGWDQMTALESNDEADVLSPGFVMDKQGNATVVWSQTVSGSSAVWFNRYEIGTGWSGAQRIEPDKMNSNASEPRIASDDAGNVLAIWIDSDAISATRFVVGRGWDPVVKISEPGKPADSPSLSVSGSGVGMAAWQVETGSYRFSRFE